MSVLPTPGPASTSTATPIVFVDGTASLFTDNVNVQPILEGYIDLDTGAVATPLTGDLVFLAGYGTDLFFGLMPVNGASGAWMGSPGVETPRPTTEDCAQVREFFTANLPIGIGVRLCVLTNEGRLSLVWVDSGDNSPPYRVGIRFVTWE